MIVGPHAKTALRKALETAGTDFQFVDTDEIWKPKLFMFLDASLIESSTQFEAGDNCGNTLEDLTERSTFYIYAVSIAENDGPTVEEIELDVARFTSLVVKTIAADTTLGLGPSGATPVTGATFVRVLPISNETSTRQMQSAGGQPYNACRAFLQIDVEANLTLASLDTVL